MTAALSFLKSEAKIAPKKELAMVDLRLLIPQILTMVIALVLILMSALSVIYTSYDYRRLFHQHQTLVRQNDQVRIEWGQLLLEQSTWGSNNRVEVLAEEKLLMQLPQTGQVRLVLDE